MKITPLDIRKHQFDKKMRGYDPEAVDAFLFLAAEEFEKTVHERESLREKVSGLEGQLSGFDEREKILKRTLYTAQKTADEQKANARKEAELTQREAELRAEQIVEAAQRRALDLEKDIMDLKLRRHKVLDALESLLSEHQKLVDLYREEAKSDDRVKAFEKK